MKFLIFYTVYNQFVHQHLASVDLKIFQLLFKINYYFLIKLTYLFIYLSGMTQILLQHFLKIFIGVLFMEVIVGILSFVLLNGSWSH